VGRDGACLIRTRCAKQGNFPNLKRSPSASLNARRQQGGPTGHVTSAGGLASETVQKPQDRVPRVGRTWAWVRAPTGFLAVFHGALPGERHRRNLFCVYSDSGTEHRA
jgi:hypothetical protein